MIRLVRLLRKLVGPLRDKPMAVAEFAVIVAIIVTVAGDVAFAAGWVSPGRITALTIIEALAPRDGQYRGSVGVCPKGRVVEHNFRCTGNSACQCTAKPLVNNFQRATPWNN